MTWWQAIILGIVEGLTEYLPVSSTGHLLVVQELLGIGTESQQARQAANAYAICIQAGAIAAVLGLYWSRVKQTVQGWAGRVGWGAGDADGFQLGLNIVVAFIPAAIIGFLLDDWIESKLFGPWPIVAAWAVGGVAILVVSARRRRTASLKDDVIAEGDPAERIGLPLERLTVRMALVIGLIQCLAMWPGTSRSLVTIVGGVLIGLSLAAAVEFSFLLGVLTLCAATVYKAAVDQVSITVNGETQDVMMIVWMARVYGWPTMLIGSVAAWLSAVLAVKWMVAYLKRHGMEVFGYYRIAIAVIVAGLLMAGVIDA